MSDLNADPLAGMEEQKVEYNNLKFGSLGDWFRGTLVDNSRQIPNNLSAKREMQTIYEFQAKGGLFHDIIKRKVQETPTEIKAGEFWSYITSKPAIVNQLKKAQIGQIVGFRLAEIKEASNPAYDDAKIIKVYIGEMDPEYKGQVQGE